MITKWISKMGGGSKQTTQATTNEPSAMQKPAYQSAISGAQNLHNAGVGSQVYQGSTVIPFSQQSMQGFQNIEQNANNNVNGRGISGQYQSIINNGGYNGAQSLGLGGVSAASRTPVDTSRFENIASRGSYSERNLNNIASGHMLNRSDPNFERVLNRSISDASNQINMGASGAGRYGSAVHQGNVARNIGDMSAQARLGQYNQERSNQMQANSMLDSQRNANNATRLSAANSIAGNQQNDLQRMMSGASSMFNMGQTAQGNLANSYQGLNAPNQDLMNVGSQYEDLATRLKNDELRVFNESQSKPWESLARLNGVTSGAGNFGTSTTTATQPGANPWGRVAGAGLGLAGLFGG